MNDVVTMVVVDGVVVVVVELVFVVIDAAHVEQHWN